METMTATEFAKNLKRALDRLEFGREEIIIVRNNHKIARIIPGSPHMTALEAMGDLYRTLPADAAEEWLEDSRLAGNLRDEVRDPWDS
ncbi:MAG: type II toxin-antitoxin system Phd/YefM family antitoxin [Deltaproteobacteria bacterium]|nr:type II toxin-antitoxin system Phd/YefM family antitoxin [Deltaproteobacteria bacterium]